MASLGEMHFIPSGPQASFFRGNGLAHAAQVGADRNYQGNRTDKQDAVIGKLSLRFAFR